jgi:hypothetical protein
MVNRVVSTKLTEEEHSKLLEECAKRGCTPSLLMKEAIMMEIQESKDSEKIIHADNQGERVKKDISGEELKKFLGLRKTPSDNHMLEKKPTLEETIDHMKNCRNPDCKYGRKNLGIV